LDIWRVRPGTLIVDDSGPHCFDTAEAIARMEQQGDVLVGEGGEFHVPTAMREVRHTSSLEGIRELLQQEEMIALRREREIMGCLNSGILSFSWGVPTTLGLVDVSTARQHYDALVAHGFRAAHPHLTNYVIAESILQQFRRKAR